MTRAAPVRTAAPAFSWPFLGRVLLKALLLFVAFNLAFAALYPMGALGRVSLYNLLFPGRERFPFGENPQQSYNLSLYNLDAMFASLALNSASKPAPGAPEGVGDEYRVLVVGDSSVWGTLLRPADTLAGRINALGLTCGGKAVHAYNLGYPTISVTKDLMVLQQAMDYNAPFPFGNPEGSSGTPTGAPGAAPRVPDRVIWMTTLEGMLRAEQLRSPILANNAERARDLIARYNLQLDPNDPAFAQPNFWEKTIVGARRPLADLLRLQFYGVLWGATGIDQVYDWDPARDAAQRDFQPDPSFHGLTGPTLDKDLLAMDVLAAGFKLSGSVPLTLVNEPILVSSGQNSAIRYNFYYPRWAYDAYRVLLAEQAKTSGWSYLDLWDLVPEAEFTNSAIHLTPAGETMLAQAVGEQLCK